MKIQNGRILGLGISAVLTIVFWRLPFGNYLLFPFTIMATWFHEMGHGLSALILGGTFLKLSLFSNGSGLATTGASLEMGRVSQAAVAACGPLGPALAGMVLIFSSIRPRATRFSLVSLAVIMFASVIIWIRTGFGMVMIIMLGMIILATAIKGSPYFQELTVQFLGLQACISVYQQVGYLFTDRVQISGNLFFSDTGQIARQLFLPYWFWGILLTFITLCLPCWSIVTIFRKRSKNGE